MTAEVTTQITFVQERVMTLLLERPTTGEEAPEELEGEYLFFVRSAILGRTSADCWVCAWKFGYTRWPECTMALAYQHEPADLQRRCYGRGPKCQWVFFEGETILGSLSEDCMYCALRQGIPGWPTAGIALVVPTEPADVHLECRTNKRR